MQAVAAAFWIWSRKGAVVSKAQLGRILQELPIILQDCGLFESKLCTSASMNYACEKLAKAGQRSEDVSAVSHCFSVATSPDLGLLVSVSERLVRIGSGKDPQRRSFFPLCAGAALDSKRVAGVTTRTCYLFLANPCLLLQQTLLHLAGSGIQAWAADAGYASRYLSRDGAFRWQAVFCCAGFF